MEKLQCIVCGGTLIEFGDKILECESCGNKFKKSDISKISNNLLKRLSEISKEEEIKNLVIRADEFFENKDYSNARFYYNKVLDLDVKNQYCRERLEFLKKQIAQIPVGFVKPYLKSSECLNYFLQQLKYYKGIPIDIYEKVNIISVEEKFYQFGICSYNISGFFSATAIDVFDDAKPWNGRYEANERNKVYCQSKKLIDRKIEYNYNAFTDTTEKLFSIDEYEKLDNFDNIRIDSSTVDLLHKAKKEAESKCESNAQECIKDTSIKKLNHIKMKHDKYEFNFKEVYLPFCEIIYSYGEKEYYWMMSLNKGDVICKGTYPHLKFNIINSMLDFDSIYSSKKSDTTRLIADIDEQLEVLDNRITSLKEEKFKTETEMLQKIQKPWNCDILTILVLYVPFTTLIGFILRGIFGFVGFLVLAVSVCMILFCIIVLTRNFIINKNSFETQNLYYEEQKNLSEKEDKIISKINETKKRLLQERSDIIDKFNVETTLLQKQHSNPILEELAKKLTYDCFSYIKNDGNISKTSCYSLPNWFTVIQNENISNKSQLSKYVKCSEIKEKRNIDDEIQMLYAKLSVK